MQDLSIKLVLPEGTPISKMCREIGITRASLYYYRHGDRIPEIPTIIKISDYLGKPIDDILKIEVVEVEKLVNSDLKTSFLLLEYTDPYDSISLDAYLRGF